VLELRGDPSLSTLLRRREQNTSRMSDSRPPDRLLADVFLREEPDEDEDEEEEEEEEEDNGNDDDETDDGYSE